VSIKIIAKNKKASFDYFLEEKVEAGMVLVGTEVKSLRLGKVNFLDSFVTIDNNFEAWIYNLHISQYEFGNRNNHLETRKRKLLLNKKELIKLEHLVKSKKKSLIPTMIYFSKNRVKLELAVATGKKLYDKRESEKKKSVERQLRQGDY